MYFTLSQGLLKSIAALVATSVPILWIKPPETWGWHRKHIITSFRIKKNNSGFFCLFLLLSECLGMAGSCFQKFSTQKKPSSHWRKKKVTMRPWECDYKSQTKTALNTAKSQWNHKPRNTVVDFNDSVLLRLEEEDCPAAHGEVQLGGSHSDGFAGSCWRSSSCVPHWRVLGLLAVLGLLPFLKSNAFAERSKCLYYLLTLHQIHWNGKKNVGTDLRGKRVSSPFSFCGNLKALWPKPASCSEQGRVWLAFSLQPFSWRCLIATNWLLPSFPVTLHLSLPAGKARLHQSDSSKLVFQWFRKTSFKWTGLNWRWLVIFSYIHT